MKIITISDLHGKGTETWGDIVDKTLKGEFDKAVFLGDYPDSWTASNEDIYNNLESLIKIAKFYPEKIILLVGNHCVQYMLRRPHESNPYSCSGYRPDMHQDLYDLYDSEKHLFKLAYQQYNYLWTHAGIHKGWWEYDFPYSNTNIHDIANILNDAFKHEEPSIFQVGHKRGGFKDVGGPLWADKSMTYKKPLEGLHQIVGHSRSKIETIKINDSTSITFTDCLDEEKEFYVLDL